MAIAYIAAGSNLGDRAKAIATAKEKLGATAGVRVLRASTNHETAAVGGPPGQGAFLNAVFEIETEIAPRALLDRLLETERTMGRVRSEKWGPREIDLDLIFYGDAIVKESGLEVPHPLAHVRRFVLAPLAELAPDVVHPVLKKTVRELLDELPGSSFELPGS